MKLKQYYTQKKSSPYYDFILSKAYQNDISKSKSYKTSLKEDTPEKEEASASNVFSFSVPENWGLSARTALFSIAYKGDYKFPKDMKEQEKSLTPSWLAQTKEELASKKYMEQEYFSVKHEKIYEDNLFTLCDRIAGGITDCGLEKNYFNTHQQAKVFFDELRYILSHRLACPSKEIWHSAGLSWAYNIQDTRLSFSNSLPPFTHIESPECENRINQKALSDLKVTALATGMSVIQKHLKAILKACTQCDGRKEDCFDPKKNAALMRETANALKNGVSPGAIESVFELARQGETELFLEGNFIADENSLIDPKAQSSQVNLLIDENFMKETSESSGSSASISSRVQKKVRLKKKIAQACWLSGQPTLFFEQENQFFPTMENNGWAYPSSHPFQVDINLYAFLDKELEFNLEGYLHVIRIMTIAVNILYESPDLQQWSQNKNSRPISLGYTNLDTLLLAKGLDYRQDTSHHIANLLTALLTGSAYQTSMEIAQLSGHNTTDKTLKTSFINSVKSFQKKLLQARSSLPKSDPLSTVFYEKLSIKANIIWEALAQYKENKGIALPKNFSVTSLSFSDWSHHLLEADSKHADPVKNIFSYRALQDYNTQDTESPTLIKELSTPIKQAFQSLKLSEQQVEVFKKYYLGQRSLKNTSAINETSLIEKGFTEKHLSQINYELKSAENFNSVFNPWVLGTRFYQNLLNKKENTTSSISASIFLQHLGFSKVEIDQAEKCILGQENTTSIHNRLFKNFQDQSLSYTEDNIEAQIKMHASIQSSLSGGHTAMNITMPHETNMDQIYQLIHYFWKKGIKSFRIERKQSSLYSPKANNFIQEININQVESIQEKPKEKRLKPTPSQPIIEKYISVEPNRQRLPDRRKGYIQKSTVGGHKVYLHTGEFDDGQIGEIFIDMHKEGAAFRSLMNNFAIAISIGLQYGVPLEEFVDAFLLTRFSPAGVVSGNDSITSATSILDYIFRELAVSYLGRTDLAQNTPEYSLTEALNEMEVSDNPTQQEPITTNLISKGFARGVFPDNVINFQKRETNTKNSETTPLSKNQKGSLHTEGKEIVDPPSTKLYTGDPCHQCGHFTVIEHNDHYLCEACSWREPKLPTSYEDL